MVEDGRPGISRQEYINLKLEAFNRAGIIEQMFVSRMVLRSGNVLPPDVIKNHREWYATIIGTAVAQGIPLMALLDAVNDYGNPEHITGMER